MATRFYLPSAGAADVAPTVSAEWDFTTTADLLRRKMVTTRINSAVATYQTADSVSTTNRDTLARQYVSDPIPAQTISGTVRGQVIVREGSTGNNMRPQLIVRVVSNDGLTERGVLYGGDLTTLTGNPPGELPTTLTNQPYPRNPPATLASVTAQDGDRIVIEIGARKHANTGTGFFTTFNDNNATDLPLDNTTTTTNNPWFEFSQDLFAPPSADHPLTGAIAGASTANAVRMEISHPLAATVMGSSTVAAIGLAVGHPLTAIISATSIATATRLVLSYPLTAHALGTSTSAATALRTAHPLTGPVAGISSAAVTSVTLSHPLAAAAAGTSASAASKLSLGHPLTATVAGDSAAAAGSITASHPLTASVAGASATTAEIAGAPRDHALTGTITGASVAEAGGISLSHPLMATVEGSSAAIASTLIASHLLVASVTGDSDADALSLVVSHDMTATVAGASLANAARIALSHPLTGSVAASSMAAVDRVTASHPLDATVAAAAVAEAERIILSHQLAGSIAGLAMMAGDLTVPVTIVPSHTFHVTRRSFVTAVASRQVRVDLAERIRVSTVDRRIPVFAPVRRSGVFEIGDAP